MMRDILAEYEEASGQMINYEKSTITVSKNVDDDMQNKVAEILKVRKGEGGSRYLGLPSLVGRRKKEILGFIKDRIVSRVNSWNNKFLSKAGKDVLLKSVIQAIPSYAMSVFLLPLNTCKEIETLMNGYWWGHNSNEVKGIRWMTWSRLCKSKKHGGLGFRSLRNFNLALLGKQAWRMIQNPNTLMSRIYKARYFPGTDFLNAKVGSNPSFIWRSVWESQKVIKAGARWRVGDGNSINIWTDPWLPNEGNGLVQSERVQGMETTKVSHLLTAEGTRWNEAILNDLFHERDKNHIMNIPLSSTSTPDKLYWSWEGKGNYSVRSCYRAQVFEEHEFNDKEWTVMWGLDILPKVKNFFWRACQSICSYFRCTTH